MFLAFNNKVNLYLPGTAVTRPSRLPDSKPSGIPKDNPKASSPPLPFPDGHQRDALEVGLVPRRRRMRTCRRGERKVGQVVFLEILLHRPLHFQSSTLHRFHKTARFQRIHLRNPLCMYVQVPLSIKPEKQDVSSEVTPPIV